MTKFRRQADALRVLQRALNGMPEFYEDDPAHIEDELEHGVEQAIDWRGLHIQVTENMTPEEFETYDCDFVALVVKMLAEATRAIHTDIFDQHIHTDHDLREKAKDLCYWPPTEVDTFIRRNSSTIWKTYIIGVKPDDTPDPNYWLARFEAIVAPSEEMALSFWYKEREGWLRPDEAQHVRIWDILRYYPTNHNWRDDYKNRRMEHAKKPGDR